MRNTVGNCALANLDTLDLAQLELCLLSSYPVDSEAALGIVDETEVLAGFLDRDDVHEAGREGYIGANLSIDLDKTLHEDSVDLTSVERILQAVSEENDQGKRVTELVRTRGGLGSIGT